MDWSLVVWTLREIIVAVRGHLSREGHRRHSLMNCLAGEMASSRMQDLTLGAKIAGITSFEKGG